MRILSIETSCDDTGVAILEASGGVNNAEFKVLANNLSSQVDLHNKYGGVYPMLAKREHIKNLPILLEKTLKEAGIFDKRTSSQRDGARKAKIQQNFMRGESGRNTGFPDLICVTSGPGLEPTLWTGITFAQELSKKWGVPVMPVNHMEGHIFSIFGKTKGKFKIKKLKGPILSLLVSGGHTELVLSKRWMNYEIIGETLDDAVGEAFDKVARMLGLPYPGGPEISRLAKKLRSVNKRSSSQRDGARKAKIQQNFMRGESGQTSEFKFPRPMINSKDFNFSYSGLKTSVLYFLRDNKGVKPEEVALEFENAAIECLTHKTKKAIEKFKAKTLIVGGGVAANNHLRKEIKKIAGKKVDLLFPTMELTRDNAVMIGTAGYLKYIKNKKKVPKPSTIQAEGRLRLV